MIIVAITPEGLTKFSTPESKLKTPFGFKKLPALAYETHSTESTASDRGSLPSKITIALASHNVTGDESKQNHALDTDN